MTCSKLPVSIVIVGVGNADFGMMRKLDDDKGSMSSSQSIKPIRDCVQFVEFNKFKENTAKLSEQVLMEIPSQIEQY